MEEIGGYGDFEMVFRVVVINGVQHFLFETALVSLKSVVLFYYITTSNQWNRGFSLQICFIFSQEMKRFNNEFLKYLPY